MPEVISDTSPLQYLFQLNLLDLLPRFYGKIVVPQGVAQEIDSGQALGVSLPDLKSLSWVRLRKVRDSAEVPLMPDLGIGEREVLALALERPESLVILDDSLARWFARRLGLQMTGTLGVLLRAKRERQIPFVKPFLDRLEALHFRLDGATRASVLELAGE